MARGPPARRRLITHGPASQEVGRETRRQHMRLHVVALGLGAVIAAGALTSSADATLCLSRSGKMKHRDSCKPKETPVDMSGKAGPQGPPGPTGPAGLPEGRRGRRAPWDLRTSGTCGRRRDGRHRCGPQRQLRRPPRPRRHGEDERDAVLSGQGAGLGAADDRRCSDQVLAGPRRLLRQLGGGLLSRGQRLRAGAAMDEAEVSPAGREL
jgi:hypothetical protein